MNIKIYNNIYSHMKMCLYCSGTGKLKAMQSAISNNGTCVRTIDKIIKCKHCEGTGYVVKQEE